MKRAPKKPVRDDADSCWLCNAPMPEIEALGAYLDHSHKLKQFPICLQCIRAAQRKRLVEQMMELKHEHEASSNKLALKQVKARRNT